ncbi:mechanosensitive ion channel family protein [Oscillospiraceae bacterium OttesenSCG-928-F05]|nr:mechanosensitive ion channel family protein [Oscillospiraceae bacterium OttesenSCG-928-F05]
MNALLEKFAALWEGIAPNLATAVITVLIGLAVLKIVTGVMKRALKKTKLDPSLGRFLRNVINVLGYAVLAITALSILGVPTSGLITALGAGAVAVSLALKDSLSNVAGGVLILVTQPFFTGDYIEFSGLSGTVVRIDVFLTVLRTPDNKQITVPNGQLVNEKVINYSREANRRLDLTVPLGAEADIGRAKALLMELGTKHPGVHGDPEPVVGVTLLERGGVTLTFRVWCAAGDYFPLMFELNETIKRTFEENGMPLPSNKLDVMVKERQGA